MLSTVSEDTRVLNDHSDTSVHNQRPIAKNIIAVREADPTDQQRWDTYALAHPDASPYHLFAWKLTIEKTYGHRCYYLYAEQHEQVVGILPIVRLYLPGIVDELTALPYCDLGSCLSNCASTQDALLREAITLQQKLKAKKLNLRGSLRETELKNNFFRPEATRKVRMLLDLPPSADELFAGFKSKLRSQIRKAQKNAVTFRWGGKEDWETIYAVFSQKMLDLGSPVHSHRWLDNVLALYSQRAKVGLVSFENKLIGMGIILLAGKGVCVPWATTLPEYNHLSPNMLLYWNFLQFSADHGFTSFDFGRSTEDEGTYKFKRQWCATPPKPLPWYTCTLPAVPQLSGRYLAAAVWRRLPLAMANTIGPFIRKYISL